MFEVWILQDVRKKANFTDPPGAWLMLEEIEMEGVRVTTQALVGVWAVMRKIEEGTTRGDSKARIRFFGQFRWLLIHR
jgi:hypothetical protein